MSQELNQSPQLPLTSAIQNLPLLAFENWFDYAVRVQPHHTDYAGIVWHGSYLTWMEEARGECWRSIGIEFADLVALGCDLPVVELSIRYHRPIQMGMSAIVKTRMMDASSVRINWDYKIQSLDAQELYVTAQVTLAAVDLDKGRIMRQLPPPQLSPTGAIQNLPLLAFENWFDYAVRVQPHHTDYAGIVWHGSYLTWMEEARGECWRSIGIEFADLVALGCDLPVVELSIRYHRPIQMGMSAIVKTRMMDASGVRINWDYKIQSLDAQELYVTAQVTLVAVDLDKGRIMRQLPPTLEQALARLTTIRGT